MQPGVGRRAPILYVDHSVVAGEAWWPYLEQAVRSGKMRLALSLWNLFEIGAAEDAAQQERRLTFLQSLDPLWVVERRAIQKQEVRRFLWRHHYGLEPNDELLVVTPHLSVVNSFLCGPQMRIGLTPRQFIRGLDYKRLNPLKRLSPEAQITLKTTQPAKLKAFDKRIFTGWVGQSMPDRGPDERLLTSAKKAELAVFCHGDVVRFLAECPAMAVEDALTTDRTNDRRRKPTEQDGPDAQHTIVALAYGDVFCTRDRHQAHSARVISKILTGRPLANVCKTPEQLAAAVSAQPRQQPSQTAITLGRSIQW